MKTEWLGYRMVKKLRRYVKPFSSDTGTLRTDGQTHGPTGGSTDLLYQYRASVFWRAIKIVHNVVAISSTVYFSSQETHAPGQITTTNTRTSLLRDFVIVTQELLWIKTLLRVHLWTAVYRAACVPAHRRDIPATCYLGSLRLTLDRNTVQN